MDRCEICKYWKDFSSTSVEDGHCRRFPPALDPNYFQHDPDSATEESSWYGFTIVYKDDWCGEFAKKIVTGRTHD